MYWSLNAAGLIQWLITGAQVVQVSGETTNHHASWTDTDHLQREDRTGEARDTHGREKHKRRMEKTSAVVLTITIL